MSDLLEIKQERIPILRNRVISAAAQNRWNMSIWALGEFAGTDNPDKQNFYEPQNECNTAFCGAGWGAMDAGYVPAYFSEELPSGKKFYRISDTYVKTSAKVHDIASPDFDWESAGSPAHIAADYFGLTYSEQHFLFVTAHNCQDIDRYAAMLDVVKEGNPSDFDWLHDILTGQIDVPKAKIDPNFPGAFGKAKPRFKKLIRSNR